MEENKIIIDVEINSQEASKRVVELTGQIAKQRNELAKQNKLLKDSNGENKEAAKAVSSLKNSISENNKELRQAQMEAKAESGSINALRSSIAKLNSERNNLNTQTKEGSKRFAELTEQLKTQREQVNEASKAAGSFKDNIGNYTESVKEAIASSSIFGDTFGQLIPLISTLNKTLGATRLAFLAIPIFAVISAITLFLTKTKEGRQLLERFGAIAQAVFSTALNGITSFGKGIIEFFNDPIENSKTLVEDLGNAIVENITNRIDAVIEIAGALGVVFKKLFEKDFAGAVDTATDVSKGFFKLYTGVDADDAQEFAQDFAKGLEETAKQADAIAQSSINARNAIRGLTIESAKQQRIAEENRKLRDDETKTEAERLVFNRLALEAEEKRRDSLLKTLNLRKQIVQNDIALAGGIKNAQDSQLDELAGFEAEKFDVLEDFAGRTTELLTEGNNIRRDELRAQANLEAAILQERVIIGNLTAKEELEQRLEIIRKRRDAELVGLNDEGREAQQIKQEFRNEELELIAEFDEAKLKTFKRVNEEILKAQKETIRASIELAQKQLEEEKRIEDAKRAVRNTTIQNRRGGLESLRQLAGEESAIGKAALIAQQGIAIADVVRNTIVANSGAVAAFPLTAGQPFVAINTASAILGIANIIKETASALSGGFAEGGYTGDGGKYQPAGIVHRGEVVFSQRDVSMMGGVSAVERIRPTSGYADGGVVGASTSSSFRSINSNRELQSSIANNPIFVAVTDINKQQGKYAKVEQRANS
jgi:hypothetical protein